MATHSSILTWKIQRTEEPGGLQSMGRQSQTQLGSVFNSDSENTCKPTLLEKQIPSKSSLQCCQNL